jgi:hypothetical protein
MADISQLVKSSGINMERTSTELFGVAVEDFARNKINPAVSGAFGVNNAAAPNRNDGTWHASDYAAGAANSNARPKFKFMFKVQFLFKPNIQNGEVRQLVDLLKKDQNFTYMIKSIDRPKVDYEYEDVNMYNFRTKVLKQIKHRALTLSFIEDVGNSVFHFFKLLMMAQSPITRQSINNYKTLAEVVAAYNSGSGMAFGVGRDFAQRGVVDSDIGNIIQGIRILQIYMDHTVGVNDAPKAVAWDFINPRIESFDLEEMSHESTDFNGLTMQFDYDFMVMNELGTITSNPGPDYSNRTWKGAPGDISPTGQGATQTGIGANAGILGGLGGNGTGSGTGVGGTSGIFGALGGAGGGVAGAISSTLSNVGARAAQKITSDTLGRQLRTVPGLGGTADLVGGLISQSTQSRLSGMVSNIGQSFARPGRSLVADSQSPNAVGSYTNSTGGGFGVAQPTPATFGDNYNPPGG